MLAAVLMSALLAAAPELRPDTVVVVPEAYREAIQPWLAYRRAQGHRVAELPAVGSPDRIRTAIRETAESGGLKFVLLVGDASRSESLVSDAADTVTPTYLTQATVNVHWGSEPQIATDNWYADLDDDHLPDVAIGRLTADTPIELGDVIRKIIAYEAGMRRGRWQSRLNFIAGVGGFGPLIDPVIERATQKFLTDGVPAEYSISMTYGSWRSPFFPDPRRFHDTAVNRFNEGCLFWVYIGHGQRTFLDQVRVPGAVFPILDTDDVPKLQARGRNPIAVFLSCYAGAFDEARDCLAEEMLRSPAGPVAVVAGSRVTMPYAMAVMGNELMKQYFEARRETLGELLMHAKQKMAQPRPEGSADMNRQLLDAIAGVLSPAQDLLDQERLEHVQLFNLLGDPLLRLPYPEAARIHSPSHVYAGTPLTIEWDSPIAGDGVIEIVCRRDRTRLKIQPRSTFDRSESALASYMATYEQANDRCWIRQAIRCAAGSQTTTLDVPDDSRGPCHVRVYVEGEQGIALGSSRTFIRRPAQP